MLARTENTDLLLGTFLSAEQLRCTEADREAAIKLLGMMERGELIKARLNAYGEIVVRPNGFHMAEWLKTVESCGTVGCIGGWMKLLKGDVLDDTTIDSFYELFFPSNISDWDRRLTVKRCAKALRAKLTTGKADW